MALEFKRNKLNVKDGNGNFVEIPVLGEQETEKATAGELAIEVSRATAAEEALAAQVNRLQKVVGSPFVANTAASMTNTDRVYVYTGSESGYTSGNWYYYDGSAWVSGGVYNSAGMNTDTTLEMAGIPADAEATGEAVADLSRQLNDETTGLDTKAPVILETASGAIASFSDGADSMPIRKIVATIEPVQADGTPSPENHLPISGWTGANIPQKGKNLLELTNESMVSSGWNRYFPLTLKAGTYTISSQSKFGVGTNYGVRLSLRNSSNGLLQRILDGYTFGDTVLTATFNVSAETASKTAYILVEPKASGMAFADFDAADLQLELGSTASDYKEYRGNTISVNWESEAGTIYGGTVTLNEDGSADVVANMFGFTVDGNYQNMSYQSNYVRIISPVSLDTSTYRISGLCNMYVPAGSGANYTIYLVTDTVLRVYDTTITSLADAVAKYTATPLQVVFPLTTPQTYHFDNVGQLKTFLGTNNVWCNTGDITELEYCADTKLFLTARDEEITGNIAPIENGTTASKAYAQGEYFWHDTKFCKALTAIASGATFTLGTNYQETTVAAELLAAQN